MFKKDIDNKTLNTRALFLSYFTVGYNLVEGVVSITSGLLAGSGALVGFGIDSFIESLSGSIMIWRFRKGNELSEKEEEYIEKISEKLVSITFFILGTYVLYESATSLINNEAPDRSLLGVVITILSILIMPTLTYLKYQTGKQLKSKSLIADSKQTLVCVLLSIVTLLGLGSNYFFNFWQADPIVGILIALYLWKEGYEEFRGETDFV